VDSFLREGERGREGERRRERKERKVAFFVRHRLVWPVWRGRFVLFSLPGDSFTKIVTYEIE